MNLNTKTFAFFIDQNQIHKGELVSNCGMHILESCDVTLDTRNNIQSANQVVDFSRKEIEFSFPVIFPINHQFLNTLVQSDQYLTKVGTPLPKFQPIEFHGYIAIYKNGPIAFYALEDQIPTAKNSVQTQAVQKAINYLLEMAQKARQEENKVREILRQVREAQEIEDKKSQKNLILFLEQLKKNIMAILRHRNNSFVEKLNASFVARVKAFKLNTAIEQVLREFDLEEIKKHRGLVLDLNGNLANLYAADAA